MTEPGSRHDVLVVVQCRHDSRRLPGKALLPLTGMPMLEFLLRRLGPTTRQDGVHLVLATTDREVDDGVAKLAASCGVDVVRGETDDLLARYLRCLRIHPAAYVVRMTADNPLTCPDMLGLCIKTLRSEGPDHLRMEGMPLGTAVDAFSADAIRRMCEIASDPDEREHINLHILRNPGSFTVQTLAAPPEVNRPGLSLTVDTAQDYRKVAGVVESCCATTGTPWALPVSKAVSMIDAAACGEVQ
jgi:spore coat polysaccharide biosynthesis protein SpsF